MSFGRKIMSKRANKKDFRRKASFVNGRNYVRSTMRGGQRL